MDYLQRLQYHFKPQKGWINDPNGLVYFDGYYHAFFQHCPKCERPWTGEEMHWGHARTKDFITWEELPIAIAPDAPYDVGGCWSGTATVKEGVLYLVYASLYVPEGETKKRQTVSVATSRDGIHFEKYAKNPVIDHFPPDGCSDFRDPAVCQVKDKYFCVMASGNPDAREARLLLYSSTDLLSWQYEGIMASWEECKYAECPSFMPWSDGKYLLATSVLELSLHHYFTVMQGDFANGTFTPILSGAPDKGPDQYAGQVFRDNGGRCILMAWIPGWGYEEFAEKNIGCLSLPRELTVKDGKVLSYPVREVQHLLTDTDEALTRTDDGFIIHREGREDVVHKGEIRSLKILRDGYILEVYVNEGERVYSVLL